jgi:hypothetical protein
MLTFSGGTTTIDTLGNQARLTVVAVRQRSMKRKKYFKLPPNAVIEQMTEQSLGHDRRGTIARTKEIYRLFGPSRSMMFSGVLTADAYYEMLNAYIFGLYISTVFAAHALIESTLSFGFIFDADDESIAEGGLSKIIEASLSRGHISKELSARLHELRLIRIAYFHSHVGLSQRSAMKRYLDKGLYGAKLQRRDAQTALRIVHEYLNKTSPGFFGAE